MSLLFGSLASAQSLPDGPGKQLFEAVCSTCHEPTKVLGKQMTRPQWKEKVIEMLQELPEVTEKERGDISEYLARSFPKKVNPNKATEKELLDVLEIPEKDARAIVQYREFQGIFKEGLFKSADDLKKVPTLDFSKIDPVKNRLEF